MVEIQENFHPNPFLSFQNGLPLSPPITPLHTAMEKMTIKQLHESDRPREKMIRLGARCLTDAELLAILIGSGNDRQTAIQLAQEILAKMDNSLPRLAKCDIQELTGSFRGMGPAKAVTVMAAMELSRRIPSQEMPRRESITDSRMAYRTISPFLTDLPQEEMWVLLLNQSGKIISMENLSRGGVSETSADVRLIMHKAVSHLASAIILAHNHPSGTVRPSEQDIQLTQRVQKAATLLGFRLNDHLIIGDDGVYFSFADEGLL